MHHDEALRDKLVSILQDVYAMENQIVEVLEKQVKSTKQYPDVEARIQEHLEATRQHRARIESRIRAYGKQTSAVKGLLSNLMGNMQGALGDARDDYVVEHYEIAMYGVLIATAQLYGDEETINAAEENLRDEIAMAQWLQRHLVEATYLSLEEDKITIPPDMWQRAQQRLDASVQSAMAAWQPGQNPRTQPSASSTVV